jgi:hypothetical protein
VKVCHLTEVSIQALKNLISETDLLLSTTIPLRENRTSRCRELLRVALALTDDLRMTPCSGAKVGAYSDDADRHSENRRKVIGFPSES